MKMILTVLIIFTFISIYSQNQLEVEAIVSARPERALLLAKNFDNGSKGFTSVEQHSGLANIETLAAFLTITIILQFQIITDTYPSCLEVLLKKEEE